MNQLGHFSLLIAVAMGATTISVVALGHAQTEIPILGLAMLAVWLLPTERISAWLFCFASIGYLWVLPSQPLALSISLLMLFPLLNVTFSPKGTWQVGVLLLCIVGAMNVGLMALQGEGKLVGAFTATLLQILCVVIMWFSARCWKPIQMDIHWSLGVLAALLLMGQGMFALFVLALMSLISALQMIAASSHRDWGERLAWILPALTFACVVVVPYFDVHSAILVSWLLILGGGLLGEFLLDDSEEEEIG